MEENDKSYSRLEWWFYIVVFPLIFTLILTGLLLTFFDYDVKEIALSVGKNIPGLSRLLTEPEQESAKQTTEEAEEQDPEPENEELVALQTQLDEKENAIKDLQLDLQSIENQIAEKKITDQERDQEFQELATMYAAMSAKKAAAVLEKLTLHEATLILKKMTVNQQANIVSKMKPEFAAALTITMSNLQPSDNPEISALQERLQLFMNSTDENQEMSSDKVTVFQLVKTIEQMPPTRSAELLSDMSKEKQEFALAQRILANMNEATRSQILTEMDINMAKQFIQALGN